MGCAVPLVIGAALATKEPVVAITGDGGLDRILIGRSALDAHRLACTADG